LQAGLKDWPAASSQSAAGHFQREEAAHPSRAGDTLDRAIMVDD
jgi:hypothetical protein